MFTLLYIFSTWGFLIARLALGYIFITHGLPKLKDFKGTVAWLGSVGFKPATLFGVLAVALEFFGGIGLVFGFLTQLIAAAAVIQFGIIILWKLKTKQPRDKIEIDLAIFALALVLLTVGPGVYALDNVLFGAGA